MKDTAEFLRNTIQLKLDKEKTKTERNMLGQFATSTELANEILNYAKQFLEIEVPISFLDPAIGTGSFYNAFLQNFEKFSIEKSTGYEIDSHYGAPSKELWRHTNLKYIISDFTTQKSPIFENDKFNFIVCNPPYVRYQHIRGEKERLKELVIKSSGMNLSGLSGLYCYFLGLSHAWMKKNGIACWLIPSEFMDVNYGDEIKNYLLNEVSLIQVHRYDPKDLQFTDALVSSSIIWFKNAKPKNNHEVIFTYGGKLQEPILKKFFSSEQLKQERKWSRLLQRNAMQEKYNGLVLCDFFTIKRGLATGNNKFFILSEEEIIKLNLPFSEFQPILPNPRYIKDNQINADGNGFPELDNKLFVLDSKLTYQEIKDTHPTLYNYLEKGIEDGVLNSYLVKSRKVWYKQEDRSPAMFYCTYIGRMKETGASPFKFILNKSKAIASNSYLYLQPKDNVLKLIKNNPKLIKEIKCFFDNIPITRLLDEGRVYGGGMYKLEPKELAQVQADELKFLFADK